MGKSKTEIITFKVDEGLGEALKGIANRSEFIRSAVLNALDNTCPLCMGAGKLTVNQKNHWKAFTADHEVVECEECHELRLRCANKRQGGKRRPR